MGKTEKGAVWLNQKLFSPYDYWQFWRNTDDRDVKRFLNFFTEIDTLKIDEICNEEQNINQLKIILANEATKILHGVKAAKNAEKTAKDTFEGKGYSLNLPEIPVKEKEIDQGINLLSFLSKNKIMSSKSEARRAIINNGLKINDILIKDEKKIIIISDFRNKIMKISHGKKRHYLVKII